jgi:HK97 family phage major capsid protein
MNKRLLEIMQRKTEIMNRKKEIRGILDDKTAEINVDELDAELRTLNLEIRLLDDEQVEIEQQERQAAGIAAGTVVTRAIDAGTLAGEPAGPSEAEKRGQALLEKRTVTVGSSNIVLPKHAATDIKPTFNEVSSLVDRVNHKPLNGGESFEQPYEKPMTTEGDYTGEGENYKDVNAIFGYATVNKAKITAYAEDSEEVTKLPAADYDASVMQSVPKALRKKITKEILVGDGTTGHLVGIFDDGATAIDAATDLEIVEIDETTLDEIIYSYGGDEDVEDVSVLVLNKKDLKSFATLRDADGKKIYDIVNNGNTGTIDNVPFIINSACKAVSDAATTSGQYCMAYGPLSNYTLAIFSDVDIQRSTDYKFKEGMIAHKGSVFVGGNVTAYNGFLRVKKG